MSAFQVTNIGTTTYKNVVAQVYQDNNYFRNDMCQFKSEPNGGATWRVPVFGASSPAFSADGTDVSGGSGYTPTNVDVSTFSPAKITDTILWSDLKTYEGYIPGNLTNRFGMDLALLVSNTKLNIIAKTAYDRAASAGQIESSAVVGTSVSSLSDTNYADLFNAGLVSVRKANIQPRNCVAVLIPEMFYALRRNANMASRDYASGSMENSKMEGSMFYGGVEILCQSGTYLGTDQSSNTSLPSTARFDARKACGVIFAKDALAVYETEPVNADIVELPHVFSTQVYIRTTFGAKVVQTGGVFVFGNWA